MRLKLSSKEVLTMNAMLFTGRMMKKQANCQILHSAGHVEHSHGATVGR
jgi:hypothetical protein